MKKRLLAVLTLFVLLVVSGCGDGGHHHDDHDGSQPPAPSGPFQQQILSDDRVDADVMRESGTGNLTVTQVVRDNVGSVFAGVDPLTHNEFRAFLDFPLGSIPLNATIQSATLDIFIDSISPLNSTIPIRIELVDFPPPVITSDFDRTLLPPLAATAILPPIAVADLGHHVFIDVTPLMAQAQALGLDNFQVRVLEDPAATYPGIIEINDSDVQTAPLLTVVFF